MFQLTNIVKKLLLAATLLASLPALAQTPRHAIKLNAISLLLKTGSVFYEHQLADNRSLNLGLLVTNYSRTIASGTERTEGRGFGLTGEYRFYPAGRALRGWFVGPYLRFQHYSFTSTRTLYLYGANTPPNTIVNQSKLTTFGGGGVFGWKGQMGPRFCIEPFLGIGYAAGQVEDLDPNNGYSFNIENGIRGLELRPGLNVGYAFGKAEE
ncbi:MAG: hypothetical protein JWR44_2312 [Hymenobacter sp.]|jgi:hypothetical protein|nr:hypothetical protein [Hymenobacter sp.]